MLQFVEFVMEMMEIVFVSPRVFQSNLDEFFMISLLEKNIDSTGT
jgi:hypothetical protein